MTSTFFKVMFSHDAISIDTSFWEDGSAVGMNAWVESPDGIFSYCTETMIGAKAALKQRMAQQVLFLNEAKDRYGL